MALNPRKNITINNRTNYFIPDKDKAFVSFLSNKSYRYKQAKQEGYENRLYWEYEFCKSVGGQTFYYTFTYNDKHIPKYDGQNCFDYNDLVYLLNGGLKKYLLRHFGTNFKYFVGAELGDGKGKRGLHNNPHYHILFFLRPANNPKYPFKSITPVLFRHLCRLYWQGFDEDVPVCSSRHFPPPKGWNDYREAKFGMIKEGDYCGSVDSYGAITYVAKYVLKDSKLIKKEKNIELTLTRKLRDRYYISDIIRERFIDEVIYPRYNVPTKAHLGEKHDDWLWSFEDLLKNIAPKSVSEVDNLPQYKRTRLSFFDSMLLELNLLPDFTRFVNDIVASEVKEKINEFRNRYSNKCRISQGVGDFAMMHLEFDGDDPRVKYPDSDRGWKMRPLGLYYYRKMFTDVVKDPFGNPLRVLNSEGIDYKVKKLKKKLNKLYYDTKSNLDLLTESFYNKMIQSDVNEDVSMSYDKYKSLLKQFDYEKAIRRYTEYKLVYEGRFFPVPSETDSDSCAFNSLDCVSDYKGFLFPSFYKTAYNPFGVSDFIQSDYSGYISYNSHPYFLPYLRFFAVCDLCADYLFVQEDEQKQKRAEEITAVKRFHKQKQFEDYVRSKVQF